MNANLFVRILVATIAAFLIMALIGPVSIALGLPLSANGLLIAKLCVAGIALFYIVTGKPA